jgi:hypothetical protein
LSRTLPMPLRSWVSWSSILNSIPVQGLECRPPKVGLGGGGGGWIPYLGDAGRQLLNGGASFLPTVGVCLMLFHTNHLGFQMTGRNTMPDTLKAPLGLIPVPEGTFQLELCLQQLQ